MSLYATNLTIPSEFVQLVEQDLCCECPCEGVNGVQFGMESALLYIHIAYHTTPSSSKQLEKETAENEKAQNTAEKIPHVCFGAHDYLFSKRMRSNIHIVNLT